MTASRRVPLLLALGVAACATPGQVRRVETQVAMAQREQQRSDSALAAQLGRVAAMQQRALDSLVLLTAALDRVERGGRDNAAELLEVRRQLLQIGQQVGQSTQRLRDINAQIEARAELQANQPPVGAVDSVRPPAGATTPAVTTAPAPGQPSSATLYSAGQQSLRSGAWQTARSAFRDLLRLYPTGPDAVDAAYFVAQSFEGEKLTDSARVQYASLARQYPRSPRAASALFKLGWFAEQRNDIPSARSYYQQVVQPYFSGTEEYLRAQEKLRELPPPL